MTAVSAKSCSSATFFHNGGSHLRSRRGGKLRLALRARMPRSIRGQAMVEFLLVAPLFFFLIFAVFDFGRLFLVQMEVENAVQEAAGSRPRGIISRIPKTPGSLSHA